jgi:hypothetical protein
MNRRAAAGVTFGIAALLIGCATVGTNPLVRVPKDSAARCTSLCAEMGLSLDSVVVMASNVGCVCVPTKPAASAAPSSAPSAEPKPVPSSDHAGAPAAGMVTILLEEEASRREDAPR